MRILHTSDWHLGRTLENRDRMDEYKSIMVEIQDIVKNNSVELVLIAGDVFDSYTPSAAAEELFLDSIEKISTLGAYVVVIAGNHDSPERLCAAQSFAKRHGIFLIGMPGSVPVGNGAKDSGKGWVRLTSKNGDHDAIIAALPYPSEARMFEVTSELGINDAPYAEMVKRAMESACTAFTPDTVNILTSHLFALGGEGSSSERQIDGIGGINRISISGFPNAQYIALGHLHKKQYIGNEAYYSGSLLQHDFSEAGNKKFVLLVDAKPGVDSLVNPIPLTSGRDLVVWNVDSLEKAYDNLRNNLDNGSWIEVCVTSDVPLTQSDVSKLRSSRERIVIVRWSPASIIKETVKQVRWSQRSMDDIFKAFYESKLKVKPSNDIVEYFMRVALGEVHDEAN